MERERLLAAAREAARHAYAPYSGFRVGAAVLVGTAQGEQVVTGANVENASLGLTLCAERSALAATRLLYAPDDAATAASPRILAVAISCVDAPAEAPPATRMPCGACRQWFAELAPEAEFLVDGVPQPLRLEDLLPAAFRLARE